MRSFLLGIAQDKRKDLSAFLLRPFLYLLSLIYGIIVRLACWGYRAGVFPGYKSKIKVISVGNITLGGTGKTPFVEFLSGYLSGQGRQVAVLSRGYNQDEPKSLVKNLAGVIVLTGRDRIRTALQAEGLKAEVIILDDGFQHWRLKRDLDIVMVNSRVFLGNRCLVPRGILREPPGSLRRADIIVLSKADKAGDISGQRRILKRINPNALIIESLHRPVCFYGRSGNTLALEYIRGRDVCLLSGIADPGSFKEIIVALGARIALNFEFPDHHPYRGQDIRGVSDGCRQHRVRTIVTTEKDLMRLPLECLDKEIELLVLKIELRIIANEEGFFNRILSLLAG